MGNSQTFCASTPAPIQPVYYRPNLGLYNYPSQPNIGYHYGTQAPTPTPQSRNKTTLPAVMDCNEAERYGGFVLSGNGSNLKKPSPQGWVPYTRSN